jgi:hypothetical protein
MRAGDARSALGDYMKRRLVFLSFLLAIAVPALGLAGCGGPSQADLTKMNAALDSMSKLGSKVEAGLVYADYSAAVGNTKGEVDLFLESAAAKAYPEVAANMSTAMQAYVAASSLWNAKIQSTSVKASSVANWDSLVAAFPELAGNVLASGSVNKDAAMQTLWAGAAAKMTVAKAAAPK